MLALTAEGKVPSFFQQRDATFTFHHETTAPQKPTAVHARREDRTVPNADRATNQINQHKDTETLFTSTNGSTTGCVVIIQR